MKQCKKILSRVVAVLIATLLVFEMIPLEVTYAAYVAGENPDNYIDNDVSTGDKCNIPSCPAYTHWNQGVELPEAHTHYTNCSFVSMKNKGTLDVTGASGRYYDLHDVVNNRDIKSNSGNMSSCAYFTKTGCHGNYFDYTTMYIGSRLMYTRLLKVAPGDKIGLVAADNDTETSGGDDLSKDGYELYWYVYEMDASGTILMQPAWYDQSRPFIVSTTPADLNTVIANDDGTGIRDNARYATIAFRWYTGDDTLGSGTQPITAGMIGTEFPNFFLCYNDFIYTFKDHNGNSLGTVKRFGLNDIEAGSVSTIPTPPARAGYVFKGWKITSSEGKQAGNGKTYTTAELQAMFKDGKYYSSLFTDAEFTAVWDEIKYNITYDLQGGIATGSNPTSYNVNTPTFTLSNPTRTGYKFLGWTGSNGSTPQTTVTINQGTTGNKNYTANWEVAEVGATVQHYVMNTDGSFPTSPTKQNSVTLIYGKSFADDYGAEYFKDSSLEKEGAVKFSGYEFPSSGVVSNNAAENIVKVYYSRDAYTVKYNVSYNGGMWDEYDNSDLVEYEYYGASANLSYKAVKNGYEFVGWNTDKDATTALSTVTITGDTTLYAVYKKTIKIGFTDALGRREKQVTVYNKTSQGNMVTPYVRDNNSWTDVSAKVAIGWTTSNNVNSSNGTVSELDAGKSITVSDSKEYYAVYKGFGKVTFDENGGTETDATEDKLIPVYKNAGNLNVVKGGDVTMPGCDRPDRNNGDGTITSFQLKGWQIADDGADDAAEPIMFPSGSSVTIKGNTDLIAVWDSATRDIEYTIVFDMNGGKNGPDPVKVKYGDEVTLQDKGSKVGFKLDGWNTKPDGTGTVYDKTAVVKNLTTEDGATVTLYAQWKKKEFFLVKISSSRYNATFIRRTEGDDAWFNSVGKITIQEWSAMTEEEKTAISKYRFYIDKDGNRTQIK